MNPKVAKLKEERDKNARKIITLQERNQKIDALVTKLENTEIIGIVREHSISPDMLVDLIRTMKEDPASALRPAGEEENHGS